VVVSAWLIDKSAIARRHVTSDADDWAGRIERGLVRISTVTRSEVGHSARSAADRRSLLAEPPIASMPVEYVTPRIEDRALELQSVLAQGGQHRGPSVPDLLVLHVDKDFKLIADTTGQRVQRLHIPLLREEPSAPSGLRRKQPSVTT